MGEEVKLFRFWASPFSRRVEIALALKGVPFECIEEDLQNKSLDLIKYNPIHKKLPVLLHKGLPILESQVILEYIDQVWPNGFPILPHDDPYERAMARFWAKFIDDKCLPSLWNLIMGPKEEWDKAKEEAHHNLKILEEELAKTGNKFFGGEQFNLIDIVATFIGYWMEAIQEALDNKLLLLTKERYPCLCRWAQDFVSCDIVKDNLPPKDALVASLRVHFGALKATE